MNVQLCGWFLPAMTRLDQSIRTPSPTMRRSQPSASLEHGLSIRHWVLACGFMFDDGDCFRVGSLASAILQEGGLESLCAKPEARTDTDRLKWLCSAFAAGSTVCEAAELLRGETPEVLANRVGHHFAIYPEEFTQLVHSR